MRYAWEVTKPAMVALMRTSMKEFARVAQISGAKVDVGPPRAETASALESVDRLADDLDSFPAPPFTSQRLCELLLSPREYYKKIEKLVHAVEKLMNVTGTVVASNAPPDETDETELNPARVRHEKDPVNVEQTAFVSSLMGAPVAAAAGPGLTGDPHASANGAGLRAETAQMAGGHAGTAGPTEMNGHGAVDMERAAGEKRKAAGEQGDDDGPLDDRRAAGPAVDPSGTPSMSAVES